MYHKLIFTLLVVVLSCFGVGASPVLDGDEGETVVIRDAILNGPANISSLINQGNQLAQNNGLSITMDGIRFVLDDDYAVTVFCPLEDSGTYSKIDYDWPVPINGQTTGMHSYLGRTPNYGMMNYYVVGFMAYGQSTRGSEIRGSVVYYNYWQ